MEFLLLHHRHPYALTEHTQTQENEFKYLRSIRLSTMPNRSWHGGWVPVGIRYILPRSFILVRQRRRNRWNENGLISFEYFNEMQASAVVLVVHVYSKFVTGGRICMVSAADQRYFGKDSTSNMWFVHMLNAHGLCLPKDGFCRKKTSEISSELRKMHSCVRCTAAIIISIASFFHSQELKPNVNS